MLITKNLHFHLNFSAIKKLKNLLGLRSYLSAEMTVVLRMLCDFHLLDGFTEGSTITGSIFASDSDLLGAFGLQK